MDKAKFMKECVENIMYVLEEPECVMTEYCLLEIERLNNELKNYV